MTEPVWLSRILIEAMHDEQLAAHGGAAGLRDVGLLESAIARPQNGWAYGEEDLCELAAVLAEGIAKNHPFVDGNKRTAFLAAYTFLALNGLELDAPEPEAALMTLELASGEMPRAGFAAWLRDRTAAV